jgi:putative flippase GtrA
MMEMLSISGVTLAMKSNGMRKIITTILDLFYPLVKRFIPKETYYYAACGGGNLVLSWFLFFFFYQYVFQKEVSHYYVSWLGNKHIAFSAYTLSSFTTFCFSFIIGFLLNRFVVFTRSELRATIQLLRYGLSALVTYSLGWILLKFFIESLALFPSIANIMASCIVVIWSYFMQRKFTFR